MMELAEHCDSADEFAKRIMVGPCPTCERDNTEDCDTYRGIENPCFGHCADCGQICCCDCDQCFTSPAEAATHDCPFWEAMQDELDELF